jgi:hypothetical protein
MKSEKARLLSEGARGATTWLRCIPTSYHNKISNVHMRIQLQFWLGTILPVLAIAPPECHCYRLRECGPDGGPGLADLRGRHETCCMNTSAAKLRRHNYVVAAIRAATSLLKISSSINGVLGIARRRTDGTVCNSQKQPDLAIYDYHRGGACPSLIDVVLPDPTAPSYRNFSHRSVGSTGLRAETRKQASYAAQAVAAGYRFKAFAVEIFGAWGPSAISLLNELTDYSCSLGLNDTRLAAGWSASHWQEVFRQYVSVGVQRGNAQLLMDASFRRRRNRGYWSEDASIWYTEDDPDEDHGVPVPPRSAPLEGIRLQHVARANALRLESQSTRWMSLPGRQLLHTQARADVELAATAMREADAARARQQAADAQQAALDTERRIQGAIDTQAAGNHSGHSGTNPRSEAPHRAFTVEERELLANAAACGCSSADLLDCLVCGPAYHLQGYTAHAAAVVDVSEGEFPETLASAPAASPASIAALLQQPDTDMDAAENAHYRDDQCPICLDDLISAPVIRWGILNAVDLDFEVDDLRVPCAHMFHRSCIETHARVNHRCPLCRYELTPDPEHIDQFGDNHHQVEHDFPDPVLVYTWPVMPAAALAVAAQRRVESLVHWVSTANFFDEDGSGGASSFLVVMVHAGLRRAGIPLPSIDLGCAHDVTLSVAWGGAIIMESWRLICDAAGCLEDYTSTLAASVNAVHHYMHRHSPATLMHQLAGNAPWPAMPDSSDPHAAVEVTIAMRNDGYIGRRGQELMLHGDNGENAAQHAVLLLAHLRRHYNPIPVVFHPPRPRDAIGQMIDAQNAAHAAAEAADLAVNNRVMSDGTMPGLEPSLAQQRRVQQGTEADEAFVGGEVPPLAPSPDVRRAAAAEAAQRRFDSLRPRG